MACAEEHFLLKKCSSTHATLKHTAENLGTTKETPPTVTIARPGHDHILKHISSLIGGGTGQQGGQGGAVNIVPQESKPKIHCLMKTNLPVQNQNGKAPHTGRRGGWRGA